MNKDDEIKESLEFCNDIYLFYETEKESIYSQCQKKAGADLQEITWEREKDSACGKIRSQEELEPVPGDFEEKTKEEGKKTFYRKEVLPVLMCIAAAYILAKFISVYVVQITVVQGDSMEAAVSQEDRVLVGKLNFKVANPKRFDVIVFSKSKRQHLIKRVIGLPGEKVEIKEGIIYIDGEVLDENYGLDPISPESDPVEMQLKRGEYFVLGDNRNVSLDSRYEAIGAVKMDHIIGKVLLRIYPFNKIGPL